MPPGLVEFVLSLLPLAIPILTLIYMIVILRDIRSGIRDLDARTDPIQSGLDEGDEEG